MRFIPQRKPCEALLSPVFEVVAESNQDQWTGKGHILLLDQNAKGTLEAQGHSALWKRNTGMSTRLYILAADKTQK